MIRHTRLKSVSAKRAASGVPSLRRSATKRRRRPAKDTERAHGSESRRAWTKCQPCVICGRVPCDAAHVKNGGIGRKADAAFTAPLCSDDPRTGFLGHHAEYDGRKYAGGKRTFEKKYGVDMIALAAQADARWQAHLAGSPAPTDGERNT